MTISPLVQLLFCAPIVLWHPSRPPRLSCLWDMCWSSSSEWQRGDCKPRDCIFFQDHFFSTQFPQFQSYLQLQSTAKTIRCAAIQEIRVIALPVCRADKPQEQSLRAGCSGSGSKGSLFGFYTKSLSQPSSTWMYNKGPKQTRTSMCSGSTLPTESSL